MARSLCQLCITTNVMLMSTFIKLVVTLIVTLEDKRQTKIGEYHAVQSTYYLRST
jgi:hypothetical protein